MLWPIGGILPLVALVIGVITALVNRTMTRREQALGLLKWAWERAVEQDDIDANRMGLRTLDALDHGSILTRADKYLLSAINRAVLATTSSAYPDSADISIDVEDPDE